MQCMAFQAADIFATLRQMRAAVGGFDFPAPPPPAYYRELRSRMVSPSKLTPAPASGRPIARSMI